MKSETTLKLIEILKTGKINAVGREELASALGCSDRVMRQCVARARLEGVCINNDMDGNGYYIPTHKDELLAQMKRVKSRLAAIARELKPLQDELADLEGQMSLEVEE